MSMAVVMLRWMAPSDAAPTLSLEWTPSSGASWDYTTPLGTVLATLQGVWSNAAPFTGSYVFVAPNYDGDGGPAPDGTYIATGPTTYSIGDVVSSTYTSSLTSTGHYAIYVDAASKGYLILNPNGPGLVLGDVGTADSVTVEAYQ